MITVCGGVGLKGIAAIFSNHIYRTPQSRCFQSNICHAADTLCFASRCETWSLDFVLHIQHEQCILTSYSDIGINGLKNKTTASCWNTTTYSKPLKPIKHRSGREVSETTTCPRCNAPHIYVYDNNGGRGAYKCKVCGQCFASGVSVTTPLVLAALIAVECCNLLNSASTLLSTNAQVLAVLTTVLMKRSCLQICQITNATSTSCTTFTGNFA